MATVFVPLFVAETIVTVLQSGLVWQKEKAGMSNKAKKIETILFIINCSCTCRNTGLKIKQLKIKGR